MVRKGKKNKKQNSSSQQQYQPEGDTSVNASPKPTPDKHTTAIGVTENQKNMFERLKILLKQSEVNAKSFEKPNYVETKIGEYERSLARLLEGVDEPVQNEIKQMFADTSKVGLFLGKKFPTLTKEHRLATTRLETYKALCTRLQDERATMKKKFTDIEEREKKWRAELEGEFELSIQDIKEQINKQEGENKSIIQHNEEMSEEMDRLQKENLALTESLDMKENKAIHEQAQLKAKINGAIEDKDDLVNHLEHSIQMNQEFKVRLEEYRVKYEELQDGLKKSKEIISALNKGKHKLLSVNRLLNKRNDEYAKKAKLWEGKVWKVNEITKKSEVKLKSLQELCRSLTEQNKELKASQSANMSVTD